MRRARRWIWQIMRDLFATVSGVPRCSAWTRIARASSVRRGRGCAPDRIGKHGQLQEWVEDWDEQRRTRPSPCVASVRLYPGPDQSARRRPTLAGRARDARTARRRPPAGPRAWRICLWARLGDGDHAHSSSRSCSARAHLPEHVRRPSAVPDRRQFRRRGRHPGNARAVPRAARSTAAGSAAAWSRAGARLAGARRLHLDFAWAGGRLREAA